MEQGLAIIFQTFGGLAMFLYGMELMSRELQRAAGQKLKALIAKTTDTPLRGMLAGVGITAVLQSSSAVTVILVGFVGAGLMQLRQAIPVVFGANIGTTVTAQLLSFQLEELRYLFLIAGLLFWFAFQQGKWHCIGAAIFGFGLLLEGVVVMGSAFEPLMQGAFLPELLQKVGQEPFLGLLTGLCMTLTVQSSSATIAILQRVAATSGEVGHSLLGLKGALPVLLGDNIGTTITAVLAALPGGRNAKRLAAAHACFNLSGAMGF